MKLVLKSDKVVATHEDGQAITPSMYPGCVIKLAPEGTVVDFLAGAYTLPQDGSLSDIKFYVSKLKVVERLEVLGKRSVVKAALASDDYQLDRWNAAQEIAADDSGVIGLFQACGLTEQDINTVLSI